LAVADALEAKGIGADVVSMPCWSLFDAQEAGYRADILPADALKVSIEAGTTLGWERYVGPSGITIGLDRFGASAPAEDLFRRFGFSAEAIVPQVLAALQSQEWNDMAVRVAINGFGRIGRLVARAILEKQDSGP
jgi:transketolase